MIFDDKRIAHLEKISLEKSRVDLSSPIVFLCGGLVDIQQTPSPSVRDSFLRYLASKDASLFEKITLAENFKDWIHDSVYKDLLEFENDIAHISSVIVIVLESPGALTELGLFARNEILNQKLIIFVNDDHYQESSFISLGPLRYLEEIKAGSVCAYPWSQTNVDESLKDSLPEMHNDLFSSISKMSKTEAFNFDDDGHISFVLYEIIKVFTALKVTEIETYAKTVGLNITRDKIKRLLFLLTKFNLVAVGARGHNKFYYPLISVDKIKFGGHFNKNDAKISTMQYYSTDESELNRLNFIKSMLKKLKEVAA